MENEDKKELRRSRGPGAIFGICEGIAEWMDVYPLPLRLLFLVIYFGAPYGFWALIIYLFIGFAVMKPPVEVEE